MVNTIDDLKEEVALRLRKSLHDREINMMNDVKPRLPHMLGITPIGKVHDPQNEEMTLMDVNHRFWQEYEEPVRTKNKVNELLMETIEQLLDEGKFKKYYPYPDDSLKSEVIRCEVERVQSSDTSMNTTCKECGESLTTQPNLLQEKGHYYLKFSIDCPECEFSGAYRNHLRRM